MLSNLQVEMMNSDTQSFLKFKAQSDRKEGSPSVRFEDASLSKISIKRDDDASDELPRANTEA